MFYIDKERSTLILLCLSVFLWRCALVEVYNYYLVFTCVPLRITEGTSCLCCWHSYYVFAGFMFIYCLCACWRLFFSLRKSVFLSHSRALIVTLSEFLSFLRKLSDCSWSFISFFDSLVYFRNYKNNYVCSKVRGFFIFLNLFFTYILLKRLNAWTGCLIISHFSNYLWSLIISRLIISHFRAEKKSISRRRRKKRHQKTTTPWPLETGQAFSANSVALGNRLYHPHQKPRSSETDHYQQNSHLPKLTVLSEHDDLQKQTILSKKHKTKPSETDDAQQTPWTYETDHILSKNHDPQKQTVTISRCLC